MPASPAPSRMTDDAVRILPQMLALDRRKVRRSFEERFSARMAKDYLAISFLDQETIAREGAGTLARQQPTLEKEMN